MNGPHVTGTHICNKMTKTNDENKKVARPVIHEPISHHTTTSPCKFAGWEDGGRRGKGIPKACFKEKALLSI